ncbi:MAG TPA: cupin domain-containing protein [Terriglobales bacterium]|nr:cupin domain-containing protein [Terriglobales bacterium]
MIPVIDLESELRSLQARDDEVTSNMLLKTSDLRILLIAMKRGARLPEHHADARLSIQVWKGSVRLTVSGETAVLKGGSVAALEASVLHSVEAIEDSSLLLTLAWPRAGELEGLPHRRYA